VTTTTTTDLGPTTRQLRALADETRLAIVELLCGGERCVCELTEALGAGQSLLSFHLKCLKECGIVRDRKEGRWVYYCLNRDALEALEEFVGGLASNAREAASECCT
jgi:ArsR family transcriptional regulator